ncbi:sulfatase [Algoriphagus aquimarinus]|nr:sulfatase [Algoriphagus aquimarinus]
MLIESNASESYKSMEGEYPNVIIIFSDDLGYGDIEPFGAQHHRTPNLSKMASEGMKFTAFYVSSGVCTPSRSSLMTGCYPRRVDMHENAFPPGDTDMRQVLFPAAHKGLNPNEITIADLLKEKGYATGMIGKWHLGDQPEFLPTKQGFDFYFGIPYSNDMGSNQFGINPPLPLLRNEVVIEAPVDQENLTKRYTEEALKFIIHNKDKPFFLYFPHNMPHNPVNASTNFKGKSANGLYGDAVEEIDWSLGQIIDLLDKLGLSENTLVIFTSDNGAAKNFGGSNSPLSGYKGSVMEGGMRVPALMRWKGKVAAGSVTDQLATTMDILPTVAFLTGSSLPENDIDGNNIAPILFQEKGAKSQYKAFYYYQVGQLQAIRVGDWKLFLPLEKRRMYVHNNEVEKSQAQLYHLATDIREMNDIADDFPEKVAELMKYAERPRLELGDDENKGSKQRPAGLVTNPKPLIMNVN